MPVSYETTPSTNAYSQSSRSSHSRSLASLGPELPNPHCSAQPVTKSSSSCSTLKKLHKQFRKVGIIANPEKGHCRKAISTAVRLLQDHGADVLYDPGAACLATISEDDVVLDANGLSKIADLLLVFGGDGTILRVAREAAGGKAPLLGINTGRLGFLSAVTTSELPEAFDKIWANAFVFESRPLIEAHLPYRPEVANLTAMNEFVISRGDVSRIIELEVSVDGEALTRYRGDGLIVSSPTGSTAYSLAAGGAIVSPNANVFALTPICPHALSNRSVIVSLDSIVSVSILSTKLSTILSADGQVREVLSPGKSLEIRRSQREIQLMRLEGSSFFQTLRQKLQWRGATI